MARARNLTRKLEKRVQVRNEMTTTFTVPFVARLQIGGVVLLSAPAAVGGKDVAIEGRSE